MKITDLLNMKYMPRWIIVMLDVSLTFMAVILSFLFRFNFKTTRIADKMFLTSLAIITGTYLLCFVVFKTYKEIVRHTTIQGVLRILGTSFIATVILLLVNYFYGSTTSGQLLIPFSVICINFFVGFFLLASVRILIKGLFYYASKSKRKPVILVGAGELGRAAINSINKEVVSEWYVSAIVDDDPLKIGKSIHNIRIIGFDELEKHLAKRPVERAIIAIHLISLDRRNEIANFFVDRGIKVSILPSQWVNDPFKIKRLRDVKIEDLLEREPIKMNNASISERLKGKRILISGAAGSIGSEIVRQVAKFKPEKLILLDMAESPLHEISLELLENYKEINSAIFIGNISDSTRMEYLFESFRPNVVFHAAAYKHVPMMEKHPQEAVINNVRGTRLLADLSIKYAVERFVMVSTDKAVNPTNVMGASKRAAEIYIQGLHEHMHNLYPAGGSTAFITTRFGNVLASNGSVIPRFKEQLRKGGPITVTHPDITRFFMTIPEACQLVLEAGAMGNGGEIFVFDMGKSIRIADLAKKMISLAGLKIDSDIRIVYTGLRPGEKLYEEVLSKEELTKDTYHPKIKIATVCHSDLKEASAYIDEMTTAAYNNDDWQCVKLLKLLVPEFISNNSKYQSVDVKVEKARQEA